MASAWGDSWGSAWGDSWGTIAQQGGGGGRKHHHPSLKKPKKKVITWSEYADQEARREALAKALAENAVQISATAKEDDELFDDEDALIAAAVIARVMH